MADRSRSRDPYGDRDNRDRYDNYGRDDRGRDDRGREDRGRDDRYDDRGRERSRGGSRDRGRDFSGGRNDGGGYRGQDYGGSRGGDYGGSRGGDYGGGRGGDYGGGRGGRGDFGGRGRGDFGGRGGRGGGRGKNRHMGEDFNFQRNLSDPGLSDGAILEIIQISAEEKAARSNRPVPAGIPPLANWRMLPNVGFRVRDSVVANHYKVKVDGIPEYFFHYDVKIKKCNKDGGILDEAVAKDGDASTNLIIIKHVYHQHPDWSHIGFSYDGRSSLFATQKLPATIDLGSNDMNVENAEIEVPNEIVSSVVLEGSKYPYRVELQYTNCVGPMPEREDERGNEGKGWKKLDSSIMTALNSAILSFAKWTTDPQEVNPSWFVEGSKSFRTDGMQVSLSESYIAQMGFKSSFKSCMAGLVLICDITMSCFLRGGNIVDLMLVYGNFRDMSDMQRACGPSGFPPSLTEKIEKGLKNAKLKLVHIPHSKKFRALGPPASGTFTFDCDGEQINVAEYFRRAYPKHKLQYPFLPCVDLSGPKGKANYVPAELATVIPGQTRNGAMQNPVIAAEMIKNAVVRPNERFGFLQNADGAVSSIVADPNSSKFGLGGIDSTPMRVNVTLLPPAKLQYGRATIEPGLAGTWNIGRNSFVKPATGVPSERGGAPGGPVGYCCIYVHTGRPERDWEDLARRFDQGFCRAASDVGMEIQNRKREVSCVTIRDVDRELRMCKDIGANVALVFLGGDDYNALKYASDKISFTTQCVRWKNVVKTPSGYFGNLLLKINAKLGGTNHTLASRLADPRSAEPQFQSPPASIAWLFDEPCMLMGVDVSHPEVGHEGASVCSVVASVDNSATQYCARVSFLTSREEIVGGGRLYESVKLMLTAFRKRNGTYPHTIVIYRDGVGDGSFDNVLRQEPIEIRNAIEETLAAVGNVTMTIKFAIVVCQKRHNSRFAFHDGNEYVNLCPGICLDAAVGPTAVVSTALNEFYINSHVSLQGTAKPCRYSLIHDEIGFKLAELELLTYWTTYLYCRCNKSVSYAAPAYYAHWAAKRGRSLLAAGASKQEVERISSEWTNASQGSMFFV